MRSSDWSSDVCSSELADPVPSRKRLFKRLAERLRTADLGGELFSGGVEAADVIVAIVEIVAHLVPRQAHRVRALAADRVIQRLQPVKLVRSEERRVGKECGSTGRFWWSAYP